MKKFIFQVINGEKPLWFTYWLIGVLPLAIFQVSFAVFEALLSVEANPTIAKAYLTTYIVSLIYRLCALTCVWRSANNYAGNYIWRFLAKLISAWGILSAVSELGIIYGS